MRSELRFLFIILGLFIAVGLLLSIFGNANHYFTGAYSTVIPSNSPTKVTGSKSDDTPSNQPRPVGFTERDIEKQHGKGYATY